MGWLGKQRNSQGGFVSTQDTVVALQAISMYSQKVVSYPMKMAVKVMQGGKRLKKFSLVENNKLLLQRLRLNKLPNTVVLRASGSGCVLVQTVLRYNVEEVPEDSAFSMTTALKKENSLEVCAKYNGAKEKTKMVVMEIEMVTGWEAVEPESLMNKNISVQRVERGKEDEETVVLYFDSWPREERCVSLPLKQVMVVEGVKPALVSLYDYYDTKDKAEVLYTLEKEEKEKEEYEYREASTDDTYIPYEDYYTK